MQHEMKVLAKKILKEIEIESNNIPTPMTRTWDLQQIIPCDYDELEYIIQKLKDAKIIIELRTPHGEVIYKVRYKTPKYIEERFKLIDWDEPTKEDLKLEIKRLKKELEKMKHE